MKITWKMLTLVFLTVGLGATSCGNDGDSQGTCADVACLHNQLAEAQPGDTVKLDAGTFEGSFTVPSGVSLAGAGSGSSILKFAGDGPVLEVDISGSSATLLQGLSVEGGKGGGVLSSGACTSGEGGLAFDDVSISAEGAVGLQVWDACVVEATGLSLSGTVTEQDGNGITADPDSTRYPVVGMALVRVKSADLTGVTAEGFAAFGVILFETPTTWDGGEVHSLVGTGIQASGAVEVTLKNLTVHDVWKGATPFGYGIVASDGVHLVTENVTVENNGQAGILMDGATGEHTNLKSRKNQGRGVWVQNCDQPHPETSRSVIFRGAATDLDQNYGVALGIFLSTDVSFSDGHLSGTYKMLMSSQDGGEVEVGDGIEIFQSDNLEFTSVVLDNNERAGIVVDGGEQTVTNITFTDVTISGNGDRGFASQNGTVTSSPTVITEGLIQADALGGLLDITSLVNLENIPSPEDIIDINT